MRVTNNTKAVWNYGGMAYAPGKSFDVLEEHVDQHAAALSDGRLGMDLGEQAEKKPAKPAEKK